MLKDQLKKLRLKSGYTQKEMAEKLDIAYQNYQRYENGKVIPRPDMVKKLASLFDVSSDYIQGRDDGLEQIINIINENSPTEEDKRAIVQLITSYFKNK